MIYKVVKMEKYLSFNEYIGGSSQGGEMFNISNQSRACEQR